MPVLPGAQVDVLHDGTTAYPAMISHSQAKSKVSLNLYLCAGGIGEFYRSLADAQKARCELKY